MTEPIRVLVADDHAIVRSGLHLLLSSESDIQVVGEAVDGETAVALAEGLRPDVVLMDIGMPSLSGFEATRQIKARAPEVNILVLTMHRSEEYFFQMLEAGASGYILKGAETSELINAVRVVARGDMFLYPAMARRLVQEFLRHGQLDGPGGPTLTPREKQVLKLIADGFSNKEIAEHLVLSPSTIHSHRANLMRKLNLTSRRELIQYARRHGLIREA
jgi:two-component system, NarL family, response regulator NreC